VQTRPKKSYIMNCSIEQFLASILPDLDGGGAQLRGGLWGRVSARCNRIVRGGHRALCRTHVWPETQTPKSRSHVMCTFWGGSTYKIATRNFPDILFSCFSGKCCGEGGGEGEGGGGTLAAPPNLGFAPIGGLPPQLDLR